MKKIVLSLAFVGFGTFAMAQVAPKAEKKMDPAKIEQKREEKLKMMQTELNLSSTQVAQIKALQDKKMAERQQMMADRKAKMEDMKSRKTQYDGEMKTILTPEQYKKWEAMKQEKMQKHQQNKAERSMKTMPAKN